MTTALKLTGLSKVFPVGKRMFGPPRALVRAVQPLSLSVEEGETLESLAHLGFHVFPVSREFYGNESAEPDYGEVEILGDETLIIGPGRTHKIVASYKGRLGIQFVWHLGGLDFLFVFAKGDEQNMVLVEDEILHTVQSVRLKDGEAKIQGLSVPAT